MTIGTRIVCFPLDERTDNLKFNPQLQAAQQASPQWFATSHQRLGHRVSILQHKTRARDHRCFTLRSNYRTLLEACNRRLERGGCFWQPLRGSDNIGTSAKLYVSRHEGQSHEGRLKRLFYRVCYLTQYRRATLFGV
jgi:hypothetical protein